MKRISLICIIIMLLLSCKTKKDKLEEEKMNWDYEKHILEIQKIINKGKYKDAIAQIEELMKKYPENDVFQLRYLIGYNYFSLKDYDTAKGYFEGLIHQFNTSNQSQEEKNMNQKFVILSNIILEKIEEELTAEFDPYHAKDEIERFKKKIRRPAKDPKKEKERNKPGQSTQDDEAPAEEDTYSDEDNTSETGEQQNSGSTTEENSDSSSTGEAVE